MNGCGSLSMITAFRSILIRNRYIYVTSWIDTYGVYHILNEVSVFCSRTKEIETGICASTSYILFLLYFEFKEMTFGCVRIGFWPPPGLFRFLSY